MMNAELRHRVVANRAFRPGAPATCPRWLAGNSRSFKARTAWKNV